jgi:hypothetical protein
MAFFYDTIADSTATYQCNGGALSNGAGTGVNGNNGTNSAAAVTPFKMKKAA